MNKTHTLETLQRAAAHLLLTAEDAPVELAAEMRHVAARLQTLTASAFFAVQCQKERDALSNQRR